MSILILHSQKGLLIDGQNFGPDLYSVSVLRNTELYNICFPIFEIYGLIYLSTVFKTV